MPDIPMNIKTWVLMTLCLGHVAGSAMELRADSTAPANLVLRRGAVYTLDAARSWAEAVAIAEGRIVAVGTNRDVDRWIGPRTRTIDLDGKMVLPGFHDAHVHPTEGLHEGECLLDGLETAEQITAALRRHAEANPNLPWIQGRGWLLPVFPDANPSKALLDRVVPDRPAYLIASDGHSAWVNSRALAAAGITKETPDPPHGRIERDPATGEPTGTLRESAMDLVARHLPKQTPEEIQKRLRQGLELAARSGLTALQEAAATEEILDAYAEFDRRGELTARIVAAIAAEPEEGVEQIPRLVAWREKYRGRRLRADAVKLFADGVIEAQTAALLEPYIGSPGNRGRAIWEPAALDRMVTALDREGFQVHVHAIGDRAIRMALDAFAAARASNGVRDARHHIAHLELIDPHDIPRFRQLGVIANFQPLWAQADPFITELTEPVLGPDRSRRLYPIGNVEAAGAVVVFGSDWPVTSINPLEGIQVAVTRRAVDARPGPAWLPEERVGLGEALAAATIRGAYLDFREREAGSIEVGKAADLVVLDRNLFAVPAHRIHRTRVVLTLVAGQAAYRDPDFPNIP